MILYFIIIKYNIEMSISADTKDNKTEHSDEMLSLEWGRKMGYIPPLINSDPIKLKEFLSSIGYKSGNPNGKSLCILLTNDILVPIILKEKKDNKELYDFCFLDYDSRKMVRFSKSEVLLDESGYVRNTNMDDMLAIFRWISKHSGLLKTEPFK